MQHPYPFNKAAGFAAAALILALCGLLAGCQGGGPAPTATPTRRVIYATITPRPSASPAASQTPTPPPAVPAPSATRPAGAPPSLTPPPPTPAPAGPEDVVAAYLEAYPDDEAGMLAVLSAARRKNLPAGGAGRLLLVQGDLAGFAVQSGSQIPDQAQVVVALRAGGLDTRRTFALVSENGSWRIESISK